MAQPTSRIISEADLTSTDYRKKFVESATSPNDFATGDSSLILSTTPFLTAGDTFTDIPLYPVGLTQSFAWNEGLNGQFLSEIGSSRKTNTAGTASGSGSISKILYHGNSLVASLYRPAILFMLSMPSLAAIKETFITGSTKLDWIKGLAVQEVDLFSTELNDVLDKVVATGGLNSTLFKLPFGLIEIKRDAKCRVLSINYFEQCVIRGNQGGLNAGQFQVVDSVSFEYERLRPLLAAGPFILSADSAVGVSG